MIKVKYQIVLVVLFFVFILLIELNNSINTNRGLIDKINAPFEGSIIDIKETNRGYIWLVKAQDSTFKYTSARLNSHIYYKIKEGDSIFKPANSNYCKIYKPDTIIKLYWANISNESRNHWTFPDEWKDKWLEASEYDKD